MTLSFVLGAAGMFLFLHGLPGWRMRMPVEDGPLTRSPSDLAATLGVPAPTPIRRVLLEPVDEELDALADLLRRHSALATPLLQQELSQDAISHLFRQQSDVVRLFPGPDAPPSPNPSRADPLGPGLVYLRAPAFEDSALDVFVLAASTAAAQGPVGILIDLRHSNPDAPFSAAADLLGLFASGQTLLFELEGPRGERQAYRGGRQTLGLPPGSPIVVLIDESTRGAAELAAHLLHQRAGALLVGRASFGQPTETRLIQLPSGRWVRIAQTLPIVQGQRLNGAPLQPDLFIPGDPLAETAAFPLLTTQGPAAVTWELPARPRRNERSLLRNENPNAEAQPPAAETTRPRDPLLLAALDILRGLHTLATRPD